MRKLIGLAAACLLLAGSAGAAPLTYTGIIGVGVGTLDPIPLPGAGTASVTGGGGLTVPAGVAGVTGFAGRTTILLTGISPNGGVTTPNFPLVQLIVAGSTYTFTSHTMMSAYGTYGPYPCPGAFYCVGMGTSALNYAGAFGPGNAAFTMTGTSHTTMSAVNKFGARIAGGGFGGFMGINGVALVGALGSPGSPSANIAVGLSVVGAGGNITTVDPVVGLVQAAGAPWTTGTATVFGLFTTTVPTPNGGTAMVTLTKVTQMGGGSAVPGGSLTLVTPLYINTAAAGLIPSFGVMTLNFVPEPGTLLLLGAGVAGLAAVGSRARKS